MMLASTQLLFLSLLTYVYGNPLPRHNDDPEYDVLILGRGVAGVFGAEQLYKAGYSQLSHR